MFLSLPLVTLFLFLLRLIQQDRNLVEFLRLLVRLVHCNFADLVQHAFIV